MSFISHLVNPIKLQKDELLPFLRLTLVLVIIFFVYLIANILLIRYFSIQDIKKTLVDKAFLLANDFEYKDNSWNTDKYLSDYNSYSDGPVYIFSKDGFLIDRMNIIHGFLDTSSFEYASSFHTPQTIVSPINETWRTFSYHLT